MPLFAVKCPECGNGTNVFEHTRDDFGCRTVLCDCGSTVAPVLSVGRGLTYFSEKRPRVIWNLGPEPVVIRSHAEHRRKMKEAGVEWAPPKRGMPGCWGG